MPSFSALYDRANAERKALWRSRYVIPRREVGYMESCIPQSTDFFSDNLKTFAASIAHPVRFHRKFWEWAFIAHHLECEGAIGPGKRGLVFGVGTERLPALFAVRGCEILATDGPADVVTSDWQNTGQFAADREKLFHEAIIDRETFNQRVQFEVCDMNAIGPHLRDFDFCWSSCCLEHLGDMKAGVRFIWNSLQCLKPDGVAIHTTEYNLSSNFDTIRHGHTCIYRKRDIAGLKKELADKGHVVRDLPLVLGLKDMDRHVDQPPYNEHMHLKLRFDEYDCTSYGLVIKAK